MQNNFIQFPEKIVLEPESATDTFGRFIIQPLDKGYGVTLGNSLRRVLISSLPGTAITGIKINNVPHEFTTIKDVVEDVSEIILNLKEVRFKLRVKGSNKIEMRLKGPVEFIARHIQESTEEFEIMNPDHHIAQLNKNADLSLTLKLGTGIGYVPSEDNKDTEQDLLMIPIDSIFTPIKNVKYDVLYTRVGQKTDYEKLVLEITTDGTMSPMNAITSAARILNEHISMFIGFDKVVEEKKEVKTEETEFSRIKKMLLMNVDELKLSVRAQNCLRSANIKTLADLVRHQEVEMLQFRNFGRKSLAELGEILHENGLTFGMDVDKYIKEES
ncbi:MAG: DNA-directed RNA polymerase subunit alpha [Ignavibacteria bacterium]|jgi:DNA-directed RNA polymerase subunit alpha